MSYLDNYRSLVTGLTRGLKHARARYGIRFYGTLGLYADMLSEGARQAFISRLPGHPEQAEDALNQVGADRELPRYRGESRSSYVSRVQGAWDRYAQYGTRQELIRSVSEWVQIVYPVTGAGIAIALYEQGWAKFVLVMFSTPWTAAQVYGPANTYGKANLLYGLSGALAEDIGMLRYLVRKIKPSRSKAQIEIVPTGVKIYGTTITYGSGALYAAGTPVYLSV